MQVRSGRRVASGRRSGGTCVHAGGPLLSKFVSSFRELASFHELLRTQVELILVGGKPSAAPLFLLGAKSFAKPKGCRPGPEEQRRWPSQGLAAHRAGSEFWVAHRRLCTLPCQPPATAWRRLANICAHCNPPTCVATRSASA